MRPLSLRATLLLVWAVASFGVVFFARDVNLTVAGWPLNFWYCSQGAILVFMAIVTFYAWRRNRESAPAPDLAVAQAQRRYGRSLHRKVAIYVTCLVAFLVLMTMAERAGMPRAWIGGTFLFSTLALYAGIGIYCRTSVPVEYYVAGRRVPAMYNGMATAADWMSAA